MANDTDKVESSTIRLSTDTKKRLDALGAKNDSYEDIVIRLLDSYKQCIPCAKGGE